MCSFFFEAVARSPWPLACTVQVRDCPPLHRLSESVLAAREGRGPTLRERWPLIQPLCKLRVARSACAAVRRPHDGAVLCFGGWSGRASLRSAEHLDWRAKVGLPRCRRSGGIGAPPHPPQP